MNCRGEQTRIRIVKDYELVPIAHVQLLNEQEKKSCTGDKLTDSYYCFSFQKHETGEKGTFLCGSHAAKSFLRLIGRKALPLFNPLKSEYTSGGGSSTAIEKKKERWNKQAKQLHDAINLLVVCWNIVPGDVLGNIKETIEKYYYKEPYLREIKTINTIVSRDYDGRKLQEMINELRVNNNVREFDFNELNAELKRNRIESYFG